LSGLGRSKIILGLLLVAVLLNAKHRMESWMNVSVVEVDLLGKPVGVIVNAWNRNIIPWWLLLPQGVSGAINKRGGYQPFRVIARHGAIPLGGAVLTSDGKLPFKGIIHVAGIS